MTMIAKKLLPLLVLVLAALSLSPRAGAAPESLGPGDTVRVTVFQNPDFTTEARLSERGSIVIPVVGEVELSGVNATQAGKRIADKLQREKVILNPQVTVAVVQNRSRQVSVLGQVGKPGKYPLDDVRPTLTDVLALAGGTSPTAADSVTIVSLDKNERRTVALPSNVEVNPGDTIYVDKAPVFYVTGEVQKAGAYRLEPNMVVMQALSVGGGLTPKGTMRGMQIHRRIEDGRVEKIAVRPGDTLRPNDVLYVQESLF
jgi:polysaccharide export outer membrane protein